MDEARSACFLELLLESHLFSRVFTPSDQRFALQEMLKEALYRRRDDLMRLIVAHGGGVDTQETIQFCAAWGSKACFEQMIDHGLVGTDFNRVVGSRDAEVTRLLITHGIDVRDEGNKWNPVHDAIRASRVDVVEALVTIGCADVNAWADDLTPLMVTVEDRFTVPSVVAIASILLANGADVLNNDLAPVTQCFM